MTPIGNPGLDPDPETEDGYLCIKCDTNSGNGWSDCQGACPVEGSPHFVEGLAERIRNAKSLGARPFTAMTFLRQTRELVQPVRKLYADWAAAGFPGFPGPGQRWWYCLCPEDPLKRHSEREASCSTCSATRPLPLRQHPLAGDNARCGSCGWEGECDDLLPDDGPDPHACGKDECPHCHAENFIVCCVSDLGLQLRDVGAAVLREWLEELPPWEADDLILLSSKPLESVYDIPAKYLQEPAALCLFIQAFEELPDTGDAREAVLDDCRNGLYWYCTEFHGGPVSEAAGILRKIHYTPRKGTTAPDGLDADHVYGQLTNDNTQTAPEAQSEEPADG